MAHASKHSIRGGSILGPRPDSWVWPAILVGVAAIAGLAALHATVGARLGLGSRMEPVAYYFLAAPAAVILVTYLMTFIRNEMHAGLSLLAAWAAFLSSVWVALRYFG